MSLSEIQLKNIVEAALMAADQPLNLDRILALFQDQDEIDREQVQSVLAVIGEECGARGVELKEVGSGYRFQAKQDYAQWLARLWEEKPPKYSRAILETLVLIAYRQPITRGEIEEVRGVSVSTHIVKTLLERDWVKVVGHRDVPGKPALYATTKGFLDYFNLRSLDELPTLSEIKDLDKVNLELLPEQAEADAEAAGAEGEQTLAEQTQTEQSGAESSQVAHSETATQIERLDSESGQPDGEAESEPAAELALDSDQDELDEPEERSDLAEELDQAFAKVDQLTAHMQEKAAEGAQHMAEEPEPGVADLDEDEAAPLSVAAEGQTSQAAEADFAATAETVAEAETSEVAPDTSASETEPALAEEPTAEDNDYVDPAWDHVPEHEMEHLDEQDNGIQFIDDEADEEASVKDESQLSYEQETAQ